MDLAKGGWGQGGIERNVLTWVLVEGGAVSVDLLGLLGGPGSERMILVRALELKGKMRMGKSGCGRGSVSVIVSSFWAFCGNWEVCVSGEEAGEGVGLVTFGKGYQMEELRTWWDERDW